MSCCDWEEGPRIHQKDCPAYGNRSGADQVTELAEWLTGDVGDNVLVNVLLWDQGKRSYHQLAERMIKAGLRLESN